MGAAITEADITVELRVRVTKGALTTVDEVFGGVVVVALVELGVDLIVIEGGDIVAVEKLVIVTGAVEGFPVVSAKVVSVTLVEGPEAGVESELILLE